MRLKLVTLIADDGKTRSKVNPLRVDNRVFRDSESARIHSGLDQTVDNTGGRDAFKEAPSGV